ncbi:MAG: anthranilate synthase component I [Chloroflexi bacterium]|jgi:anthranilate synthase component I|nr:anthranilate synthase component I [Chloroflexota bacterium]
MTAVYFPDREIFRQKARKGGLIPICRELAADLDTPVSLFLRLGQEPPTFLLESVERGENLGRYTFMGLGHSKVLTSKGERVTIQNGAEHEEIDLDNRDPLHLIQDILGERDTIRIPGLPPFCGGAVGYMSYDIVNFFEELPRCSHDELDLPDCIFLFTDTMLAFDHVQHKMKIIANAYIDDDVDAAYDEAISKIEKVIASLSKPLPPGSQTIIATDAPPSNGELNSNFTREEFADLVSTAKEYIAAGDSIQIVLSQRLRRQTDAKPFDIYRALRMLNPSPYMFYFNFGDFQIIGSSPEVLVKAQGDKAVSRPIAGTRPRGATEEEDQELIDELLADPKERAEHVMLVDLARNDLGRVCQYGTVSVPELMVIEKYSHVSHIVSEVQGKLNPGEDAFSLLRASFPAGTVSGAPKIRAMEIIAELEKTKRGPYAGAVGYFDFSGNMDTCITIRTIVMKGDTVYLQGGAGIVADSDPLTEHQETLNKLKALERAIALAEGAD